VASSNAFVHNSVPTMKTEFQTMILNNHWHTCQQGDMPPNMDGGLLQSHPCIVPSPSGSSNKVPAFDKVVDRTED